MEDDASGLVRLVFAGLPAGAVCGRRCIAPRGGMVFAPTVAVLEQVGGPSCALQEYIDQGDEALAQGKGARAGVEYRRARDLALLWMQEYHPDTWGRAGKMLREQQEVQL